MCKFISAGIVSIVILGFAVWMSFVIYQPTHKKVYDKKYNLVEKRGYTVGAEAAEEESGEPEAPFILYTEIASADVAKGAKVAKKCAACHTMDKGGANKLGPNLYNLIDRDLASVAGFVYSDAIKAKGGKWTYDELFAFLSNPKATVPGTKMSFKGLKKPKDAARIIAYLRSLSDNPVALPAQ